MAQRFGGKYSPDGSGNDGARAGAYDRAEVSPVGLRANLLFVPPVVLMITTLFSGAAALTVGLIGAAVLTLGAYLLRGGLEAEAAFNARKVARRPGFPRKLGAAVLTGLGIALAAFAHEAGVVAPVLYGLAATGLFVVSFGMDPMRDKGMEGVDTYQQDRVARVVDEAEAHLAAMQDAVKRAGDRLSEQRLEAFAETVRDMARTVEEDPRDLTAARKYLGVYLRGARDAAIKFADIYARGRDAEVRAKFIDLVTDMEQNFADKTRALMADAQVDLDVEIEVLRERLAREGVRLDKN